MAVIHDVMPAFELFQPASISEARDATESARLERLGHGGRDGFLRLAEGPDQTPGVSSSI